MGITAVTVAAGTELKTRRVSRAQMWVAVQLAQAQVQAALDFATAGDWDGFEVQQRAALATLGNIGAA